MRAPLLVTALAALAALAAAGCNQILGNSDFPGPTFDAAPDAAGTCGPADLHCVGNTLQTCVGGRFQDTQTCPDFCSDQLGCVLCLPGTGTCASGTVSHACNSTGTGFEDVTCDPAQGLACGAAGICDGLCAPQRLDGSNVGCDFYPTVIGNATANDFSYAVAIANPSNTAANVRIEAGGLSAPATFVIPAGGVRVEKLPWVAALKLCNGPDFTCQSVGTSPITYGALSDGGGYHLRSTTPVTVNQFNPIEYTDGAGKFSYSNDASLLLPTNSWRNDYWALSYPGFMTMFPTELAVTATRDGTTVTITTTIDTAAAGGAPAFTHDVPGTVMLDAGDVVELAVAAGDLTGTHVTANQPVQVISGHFCTNVPANVGYCDHLEETMPSVAALGTSYIVSAPQVAGLPDGKREIVRILATADDTDVDFEGIALSPMHIAKAGSFIDIDDSGTFRVHANHKVVVGQYMTGQDAGGNAGDPSLSIAVPLDQYRTGYQFHAPTNYESNYVDVVATAGAVVMFDGTPLTFTPIGTTGYGLARVGPVTSGPGNDGNHGLAGTLPFGISVYGYGQYTSYWYPGGMNAKDLPAP